MAPTSWPYSNAKRPDVHPEDERLPLMRQANVYHPIRGTPPRMYNPDNRTSSASLHPWADCYAVPRSTALRRMPEILHLIVFWGQPLTLRPDMPSQCQAACHAKDKYRG